MKLLSIKPGYCGNWMAVLMALPGAYRVLDFGVGIKIVEFNLN